MERMKFFLPGLCIAALLAAMLVSHHRRWTLGLRSTAAGSDATGRRHSIRAWRSPDRSRRAIRRRRCGRIRPIPPRTRPRATLSLWTLSLPPTYRILPTSRVTDGGPAALCVSSGGTVTTQLCCARCERLHCNTCAAFGACGCAPSSSHTISVCSCGSGRSLHARRGMRGVRLRFYKRCCAVVARAWPSSRCLDCLFRPRRRRKSNPSVQLRYTHRAGGGDHVPGEESFRNAVSGTSRLQDPFDPGAPAIVSVTISRRVGAALLAHVEARSGAGQSYRLAGSSHRAPQLL